MRKGRVLKDRSRAQNSLFYPKETAQETPRMGKRSGGTLAPLLAIKIQRFYETGGHIKFHQTRGTTEALCPDTVCGRSFGPALRKACQPHVERFETGRSNHRDWRPSHPYLMQKAHHVQTFERGDDGLLRSFFEIDRMSMKRGRSAAIPRHGRPWQIGGNM
jgi:hypothetical protein